MQHRSTPEDLTLLGVRVLGFATPARVAQRYRLDVDLAAELLLDFEAGGWVRRHALADSSGWSMTDAGRAENEHRLAAELDRTGAREVVVQTHHAFLPLNQRLTAACTRWQIRPTSADAMAFNDHTDWPWDEQVLRSLAALGGSLRLLGDQLTARLARFARYADLYAAALAKVDSGERAWVDASDRDSCHLVWMQFHEDLLATLGLDRGSET